MKICSSCKKEKPISEFGKDKSQKSGLNSHCKICHRKAGAEYRKKNKKKISQRNKARYKTKEGNQLKFNGHLRLTYGKEAPDVYNEFFVKQKGKCFFCGKHQSKLKYRLSLEHNHKTGKLRSLCCPRCNNVIGWAEEFGLEKLIEYLKG